MSNGIILNIVTCLVVSIIALLVSKKVFSESKTGYHSSGFSALAIFWFFAGLQWFCSALRLFFAYNGDPELDERVFYVVETAVGIYMIALAYFLFWRISQSVFLSKIFTVAYGAAMVFYFYFLFTQGVFLMSRSYFATEYVLNYYSDLIFKILFAVIFLITIFDVVKQIILWLYKKVFSTVAFYPTLAILIYAMAGYFDQVGEPTGWKLICIRIILAGTALLTFSVFAFNEAREPQKTE